MTALQIAQNLTANGWPILAANENKIPLHSWGGSQLTAADLDRYFSGTTNLVGIVTGQRSGVFVIDPDEKDGKNGIAEFLKAGDVPATYTVETRSGGRHYYFRHPGPGTSIITKSDILPGVDVRGDGGYVVAPGNDGYRVIDGSAIADAPEWLLKLVLKPGLPGVETIPEPVNPLTVEEHAEALRRAEIYLSNLDANCDRDKWLSALMAVHAMTHGSAEGFELADRWSATGGERYKGSKDVARRWRSFTFDRAGGIGEGTLRHLTSGTGAQLQVAFADVPVGQLPAPTKQPAQLPQIWNVPEVHVMADAAELALLSADVPFFQRGGKLRQPIVTDDGAILSEVTATKMVDHLSRVARFAKLVNSKSGPREVQIAPPMNIAQIVLSRDGEWKFPHVHGVVSTPTLRRDGSILSAPGYDEATGLFVVNPVTLPAIPDQPTRDDALAALQLIADLFRESPFIDEASRSVALSAFITPIVRGAMDVAPLHAMAAPEMGSGKTFICDVTSAAVNGFRSMPALSHVNATETEKRLTAKLLQGQPTVLLDNVNGSLGSDFLCQAVTAPVVEVRPLGVTEIKTIRNTHTLYATGNNLRVANDMVRRTIRATLDARSDQPWLRVFSGDPIGDVLKDRGRYIAAAFTIARAYIAAGEPVVVGQYASFGEWNARVRSPLVWLGMADPLETQQALRGDDEGREVLAQIIDAWPENGAFTAAEIISWSSDPMNAQGGVNLRGLLEMTPARHPQNAGVTPARLSKWLRDNVNRIVDGRKIAMNEDAHRKVKVFSVETCG